MPQLEAPPAPVVRQEIEKRELFKVRYKGLKGPHAPERPGSCGEYDTLEKAEEVRVATEKFYNERCQRRIELIQQNGIEEIGSDVTIPQKVSVAWIDRYEVTYADGKKVSTVLIESGEPK